MARVAINGFGRIGRQCLKTIIENYPDDLEIVAINDLANYRMLAHLLKYDSTYGAFEGQVDLFDSNLVVSFIDPDREERRLVIETFNKADPSLLPWRALGIDIVIEASGAYTNGLEARKHLQAGASKVIITAPAVHEDVTICLGVNDEWYDHANHHVISNASCTTNCVAPVAKVLHDHFGIQHGLVTAIHSYTTDQNLQDGVHTNFRLARAAGVNLIPTTTAAISGLEVVIPDLRGRVNGLAVRAPTQTVSLIDFVVQLEHPATINSINDAFREAAESDDLEGILGVSDDALVSSDYIGTTYSAVVDLSLTMAIRPDFVKVIAWYDNEWGYATRVADLAAYVAEGFEEGQA